MLYQDPETQGRGCPSVYLAETGELVVQGPEITARQETPDAPQGVTAVKVAAEVLVHGLHAYRIQTPGEGPAEGAAAPGLGGGSSRPTSAGHIVVQGPRLDDDSLAGLVAVLDDETAVRVAPRVVVEAVERFQGNK